MCQLERKKHEIHDRERNKNSLDLHDVSPGMGMNDNGLTFSSLDAQAFRILPVL
jgi:hypothetical protein